jgi:hypothetical protein
MMQLQMWGSGKTLAFSNTNKEDIFVLLTHKTYYRIAKLQILIQNYISETLDIHSKVLKNIAKM